MKIKKFKKPLYVTRPILPDLEKINKELKEIWQSKQLTNFGSKHDKLLRLLKKTLLVKNLSLFNNGTTALMIAIKSLNLSGEVITTPFTFPATIHALTWNNLIPVFCDIDYDTMNIDAYKIEQLITPRTSAILAVHIFGVPCNFKKIQAVAKEHNLKIIYDAAHAFGVEKNNKSIGNFGDVSVFSFHATKLFHTVEGGAVVAKDNEFKNSIELYKNFGIKKPEKIILPGINGKMNEVQAAIGLCVLKHINKEKAKRRELQKIYRKYLNNIGGIILPKEISSFKSNFQYFVIRIDSNKFGLSRDDVFNKLIKYNIVPSKYFFPLCSEYAHYKHLKSSNRKKLQTAYQVSLEVLALPLYGELRKEDVVNICKILVSFKEYEA
jgi:dTDP-4-amino-4,6-dideoxygalactose transaminase